MPDYTDAFDKDWGGGEESARRFCRWFSGVAGIGYEGHDGSTCEGFSFDDLETVPATLGLNYHF